jgi:outer membrane immunogenic protein
MDLSIKNGCKLIIALSAAAILPVHAYQSYFAGPYVGVNAGYSVGKSSSTLNTRYVPGSYFGTSDISQLNNDGTKNLSLRDFTGGVQAGYNYPLGDAVIGIEADFNSLASSDSSTITVPYQSVPAYSITLYTKTQTDWLFTLRPRIGYVANCTLFYITGGLAVVQLKTNNTFSDDYLINTPDYSNASESASVSQSKVGGVIGGGIEYAFTQNLSVKAEYLYARFGHVSSNGNVSLNPIYTNDEPAPAPFHHSADFVTNIFRLGLNYKFG